MCIVLGVFGEYSPVVSLQPLLLTLLLKADTDNKQSQLLVQSRPIYLNAVYMIALRCIVTGALSDMPTRMSRI